ncbi:hypothetical protein P5673_020283 [Acropora cervicornis]|uniref:Uncharacterized protein n=1 Tax=Acropora cervicornis TaxID=6130 RepID=A0AAD9QA50_ACRCE|nr:hypothetical protein P5673_020283 [Acropora cervicornis]
MSSRNQSNSESDGESATTDRSPPRRFNRRAFSRVFVHLEKRLRAAPGKDAFLRLTNVGRAKEIAFTKNHTSSEIQQLLISHFLTLANLDLSRLNIISSYDRGHSMSVVHHGVPNGEKIMELFGGEAKKKIYLYWSRGGTASSNQPEDNTASNGTALASSGPSTTTALSSPQSNTNQSSAPLSPSSPSSPTLPFVHSPSLPRNSLLPSNMHLSAQPTASPTARRNDTTRPVLNAPPRGGFQTRRYLATLAGSNTDGSDASFITIAESDEDDTDLLHNDVVVNSLPRARRARPPNTLVTTTSTQATNVTSQSAGFAGALFHGDGIQVGTIKEDLYPYGLGGTSVRLGSRSDETSRCEGLLQGSCTENPSLVPLLNHSFEEVTDISKTSF